MNRPLVRMFVDENGNYNLREDLTNNNNRFLCLTGVVMRMSAHEVLEQRLDELKLKCFGSKEIVLHRREIVSAKPPFEALKDEAVRDEFNATLLKIISELRYGVISILIDKKAHVDKYTILKAQDPYALALEFADLITHPARRYILMQNGLAGNIKKTSFEQSVVEILVGEKFRRKDGVIEGAGAVFFPK